MLQLKNIKKNYTIGETTVYALKGITLDFRESEFVAVLGHSGCGKTTLLNIIGGLDQYTFGDLVINGKSTHQFTDSDWDRYRNHSIGFVFQSYNLIPHQTVLSNVELALTISGISRNERRKRALDALRKVGLEDQIQKKPNQMSGGQMQRVAIARALVNDPDILLADEPTGALDTETSIQIMDILKEISKDKLIIMVTHNPELADGYANRIIRLKDGLITDDSNPYSVDRDKRRDESRIFTGRRSSMSFFTALLLSLNNLMTKKARTILTAFAGSIGIVGIALIMSLSNGIQNYIDKVQEDTLSSYPITIEAETVDMTGMMTSLMGIQASAAENKHEKDAVYASSVMYDMMNSMVSAQTETNNLRDFKTYLDDPDSPIHESISAVQYSYDLDMNLYTTDPDGDIIKTDIVKLLETTMSAIYGGNYSSFFSTYGSYYAVVNVWQEMLADEENGLINPLLKNQYDLLYGKWPEAYNEVILVVDENNEISDMVLYSLGLRSNSKVTEDMQAFLTGDTVASNKESWSYEEICQKSFRYIFPADQYVYNKESDEYIDLAEEQLGLQTLYQNGLEVHIVGIIRKNQDALSGMLSGAIGYTHALVEEIIAETETKELVKKQLSQPETDVFSGLSFLEDANTLATKEKKASAAKEFFASADTETLADAYVAYMSVPSDEYLNELLDEQLKDTKRSDIEKMITEYYPEYSGMLGQMDDETLLAYVRQTMAEQVKEQYAVQMKALYGNLSKQQLAEDFSLLVLEQEDYVWFYENILPPVYAEKTLKETMKMLGYVDADSPKSINIYASTFSDKDRIGEEIEAYNDTVDEEDKIEYTDVVALLMSSITTIINVISYVLIAFVAISLVVSSIMIGIITYISVLERTKEIGILRAIGASKKDVARVFNAETFIVGLAAGVIGILLTLLLNIPINIIVHDLTGIYALNSTLPAAGAAFLILISIVLTLLAGLIPSWIAARKDPVEALRTE